MYIARQLLDALTMPLAVALLLGLAAVTSRVSGRRRVASWLFASAAAVAYGASITPVGDALLRPLESKYPPLRWTSTFASVGYVVVLGSGYAPHDDVPVVAALDQQGLARVVEGVRLFRRLKEARLVVSGGAAPGTTASALGYAQLARDLGVDNASLLILDKPRNTEAEARAVAAAMGGARFLLVTSASHMPRAVRLMERAGTHPIAAPTGQQTGAPYAHYWDYFLPSATGLRKTELALHEYRGLAALSMGME